MKSIWALGIASITTLSILALWRCSMVVIPLKKWNMGHREAVVIIIVIWIYSLAVTLPPLFGWGRYGLEAAHIRYARCPKSEIRLLVFCTCHHSQNGRLRRDFNCYAERCCLIAKLNQLHKGCHGYKLIFVDDPLQSERGKDRNQDRYRLSRLKIRLTQPHWKSTTQYTAFGTAAQKLHFSGSPVTLA